MWGHLCWPHMTKQSIAVLFVILPVSLECLRRALVPAALSLPRPNKRAKRGRLRPDKHDADAPNRHSTNSDGPRERRFSSNSRDSISRRWGHFVHPLGRFKPGYKSSLRLISHFITNLTDVRHLFFIARQRNK